MKNSGLAKTFGPKARLGTEVVAGVTTFLTMAYIIFVNPDILSAAGMDKTALIVVTCLVTGVITIVTGLVTHTPLAMAPGMGLNAFFAFTLVKNQGITWQIALGIVFISGLFFLILTTLGLRQKLMDAIPAELLDAIAVGIGVFIAFIGLQNMGLVVKNPDTAVAAGPFTPAVLIGLAGLLLMVFLESRHVRGSLLIGIVFATILSIGFGHATLPDRVISLDIDVSPIVARLDIWGALKVSFLAPIFTLMFMDLFDSLGTLLGVAREADMMDADGNVPMLNRLLTVDAGATMFGAFCGTSTTTAYVESASGIASGGRTGLTSVVNGLLFLLAIPLVPLLVIVPSHATAPALIMVGFFMIRNILRIDFRRLEIGFPAFIIIIMIALSYSISTGLAFGFLSYSLMKIFTGRIREISLTLWVINLMCLLFFVV
ncbi:MAG: NCS2 family permease [Acidobacteria bacterium]|nr:NCS2 family permease [Acidobacteriota bacterium]